MGSGFFFTEDGLIATNYHVIAEAANSPKQYYVEFIMFDGSQGSVEILNVDTVHDLAILRPNKTSGSYLNLNNDSNIQKGTKIYSFGNPYDLGMIIIEGLFNGLLEHASYRKILFSGSLNPGMSGGPGVLNNGSVFGVNVSTVGNDVSFFVPIEYLKSLHQEILENDSKSLGPQWKNIIRKRLLLEQKSFIENILNEQQWEKKIIGIAKVPSEISETLRCWGESDENEKYWVTDEYLTCSTEDYIYLSKNLYSGMLYLQYESYTSRTHNPIRFYNIYEMYAANREFYFSNADEMDVANFSCTQKFVEIDEQDCKVEVCARAYKKFDGLFDINFQITRINTLTDGLVINGAMLGFSEDQGQLFMNRFMKEIEWQK